VILKARGALAEGDACAQRALAILESALGAAHPTTAACRQNVERGGLAS